VAGIHIDQQRRVMISVVGPFDVAAMPPGMVHAMHDEDPGTSYGVRIGQESASHDMHEHHD